MKKKPAELVLQLTKELLTKLSLNPEDLKIKETKESLEVEITLSPQESGILVGFHGARLYSLQLILGFMLYRQTGEWYRVLVDVNDYRQEREKFLTRLALNSIQKAKFSGQEAVLPYISSSERRFVHLMLADHPDVVTESVGEDRDRRLVIKLR